MLRVLSILGMVLAILAGLAVLAFRDTVLKPLGVAPPVVTVSDSVTVLNNLPILAVRKVELSTVGSTNALVLNRNASGVWTQPGDWPVRESEVDRLISALCQLKTRFQAEPVGEDDHRFGLADSDKPQLVRLTLTDKAVSLKFGKTAKGIAYVRVDGKPEVLRIAPDVLQLVSRPFEEYRRRQLFPSVVRTKLTGDGSTTISATALPNDRVQAIAIEGPDGAYTLKRVQPNPATRRDPDLPNSDATLFVGELARVWEWNQDVPGSAAKRDAVDPGKLRAILSTLPDLFVEGFPTQSAKNEPLADDITKLNRPERRIHVTTAGQVQTLYIGAISRTVTRKEPGPPPMGPIPMPPTEIEKKEDYYYAKFENNPLIFEIRGDKFNDLFAKPEEIRDANIVRFANDEVQSIEITIPKSTGPLAVTGASAAALNTEPTVVRLTKKKGNPQAEREDDKEDRWYIGDRLAEAAKVTELLDSLAKLEAKTPLDRIEGITAELPKDFNPYTGFRVKLTATAKVVDGDAPLPLRTEEVQFLSRNAGTKKLAVMRVGWPGTRLVDDSVVTLAERSPLAYRSRRLFDTAEMTLASVAVQKADGSTFELVNGAGKMWNLIKPVSVATEAARAAKLASDISNLEATEYLDDTPAQAKLDGEYGLTKPRYLLNLGFTGAASKPMKLEIGATRTGSADVVARLNGGGVFALASTLVETLDKGAVDLLPTELWASKPELVQSVSVERGAEKYTLKKDGEKWKLGGPFEAAVNLGDVQQLTLAFAALKVEKYEALSVDAAKHGLDQPAAKVGVLLLERMPGNTIETPVTRTLLVGKPTAEPATTRFAKLADGPNQAVFLLSDTVFSAVNRDALSWIDRDVLRLDPGKLISIEVQTTETVSLKFDDASKTWKADGFDIDKQAVANLVFTAANPSLVRFAAYGPGVKWGDFGLDKPTATLRLKTLGDDKTHTIQLGKELPSGERFVRIDQGSGVGVISGAANAALARGKLALADRTVFNFDPTQLLGITRKKGTEEFELASGTGWDVVKPAKFKADAMTVEELADQLSRLRAVSIAAITPTDLKPYGLDKPVAELQLSVGLDMPKSSTLALGHPVDAAKPTGDRYARVNNAGSVKVLLAATANRLLADAVKFKDRTLAKFIDADKLTVTRGDRNATFAKLSGTWKMTEPVATEAETGELDQLVNVAAKLRADEIVNEQAKDLKPYGLDQPIAKLKFSNGEQDVLSVLLGKFDADGKRAFAKLEKGDTVVLLDAALTAKLLGEYRKRAVWSGVDAAQVQVLTVSAGQANFSFRKSGMMWLDAAKPTGKLDPTLITDTLAALAGLKAERFAADKDANLKLYGLDKPTRVIVLSQEGGVTKTLNLGAEVGGTNGKQLYASVPETGRTDVFVLSEADTAKLKREPANYLSK